MKGTPVFSIKPVFPLLQLIISNALLMLIVIILANAASANNTPDKKVTLSGKIKDKLTGEELVGATVFINELKTGTISNNYGFYSLSIPPGDYTLTFSFIGYLAQQKKVRMEKNLTINIDLEFRQETLNEVIITGSKEAENVTATEMSVIKMDIRKIRQIPALMGEIDLLKAIQLLPGVQTTSEGSTGFSVRGGNPDQNLIQLDEATVFNASHLMGFFSVFNNDAVKDVKLYKGDMPSSYGGRLSSLLDVRMKEGNLKRFEATGGIGMIASRLTLEGPLVKDKISFILSGRRTYADLFLKLSEKENLRNGTLYFYDFNGKVNAELDPENRLFFSAYLGRDVFNNNNFMMNWGNQTFTLRLNHLFSQKVFSNFTVIKSKFDYELGIPEGRAESFRWTSVLDNYALHADLGYYPNPRNTIRFGFSSSYLQFTPGSAKGIGSSSILTEYKLPVSHVLEHAVYAGNEQQLTKNLSFKYGLRYTVFQNVGKATIYNFDENHQSIDSTVFPSGKVFHAYHGLEPRLTLNYVLDSSSSIKASYSRTSQYIHLASNSASGNPLDVWFPSSPNVKPQLGDQYSLGYFRNLYNNQVETSAEVYYKENFHCLDFRDHAVLLLNPEIEGELRFGRSTSWGLELFVKGQKSRISGWISYTFSKSVRKIEEINDGKRYNSPYDKPHNISVVISLLLSKRLTLSANWVYATGAPVTLPTGRAIIGNKVVPVYSDRNAYRLPDYHRLDMSVTFRGKDKPGKKWKGEWNLSVYNVYGRKNTWVINFTADKDNPNIMHAEKTYLFSIIPSITYNFHR